MDEFSEKIHLRGQNNYFGGTADDLEFEGTKQLFVGDYKWGASASTYNVASSCKVANTDKVASSYNVSNTYNVTYLLFVLILTPTPFPAQKLDTKNS